jgi:hypothetical protein
MEDGKSVLGNFLAGYRSMLIHSINGFISPLSRIALDTNITREIAKTTYVQVGAEYEIAKAATTNNAMLTFQSKT